MEGFMNIKQLYIYRTIKYLFKEQTKRKIINKTKLLINKVYPLEILFFAQAYASEFLNNHGKKRNHCTHKLLTLIFMIKKIWNYKKLFLTSVELVITEKCNLNCDSCSNLMPYYENPQSKHTDELIKYVSSFLDIVDYIVYIKLIGGEPFLNRDFGELINYICNNKKYEKKYEKIAICSNGTVNPDKKTLEIMSKYNDKLIVFITNYGKKSEKVIIPLKENRISYEISSLDAPWFDSGKPEKNHRNEKCLKNMFQQCTYSKICNTILDGNYYLCPRQAHGTKLGKIPNDGNFFNLLSDESREIKYQKLKKLRNVSCIIACDYCDIVFTNIINKKGNLIKKEN
jgi:organic radical activating enzyme